jgi:hypothetical protein
VVTGQSAYPQASSNKTGGDLTLHAGLGSRKIVIDDWNNCSGDLVYVTCDGTINTLTEGVDWTAATSDDATATSLGAAIEAVSCVSATVLTDTVYTTKDLDVADFDLSESDATCTTFTNSTDGTLFIRGTVSQFGGWTFGGTVLMSDAREFSLGTSVDSGIAWRTTPNPDALVLSIGEDSRILYITEKTDRAGVFTLAQQTDPTLVIQSASGAGTEAERIYFQHNQTDGVIGTGAGGLKFTLVSNDVYTLAADGTPSYFDTSGTGRFWQEFHLCANTASPGGSGATATVINTATLAYLLDANTEYLYFEVDVHDDWDAASDMVVEVEVALATAETANDIINAEVVAEYHGEHEDIDTAVKTQTRTINHDITSDNAQGIKHKLTFILDYDLASNVIEQEDSLHLRFRLDSVGGGTDVGSVHFLQMNIKYRTAKPQLIFDSFPAEG